MGLQYTVEAHRTHRNLNSRMAKLSAAASLAAVVAVAVFSFQVTNKNVAAVGIQNSGQPVSLAASPSLPAGVLGILIIPWLLWRINQ